MTLRYRYLTGEVLRYRHKVQMIVVTAEPSGPSEEELSEGESLHRVLQSDPQKGWLVEVIRPSGSVRLWMDAQGATTPPEGRMTRLPAHPVEIGATWEFSETGLHWTYTLRRLEEEGSEVLANLSSRAQAHQVEEDGSTVTVAIKGTHIFSVDLGHQVYARIVTTLNWSDGRSSQSTTEVELEERG